MKKWVGLVFAVMVLVSCMCVTAFATDVARVYPLADAPAMERSQKIGPVTFSNVVSCKEVDDLDDNGDTIHIYKIIMGVGTSSRASMKSASNNVEFIYFPIIFNDSTDYGYADNQAVTGQMHCVGYNAYVDLVHFSILPYAGEKDANGNWVGGLVWEFIMDDSHTRDGEYSRVHLIKAIVDDQPYYYFIQLTNRPDYANGTIFPSADSVQANPDGTLAKPAGRAAAVPTSSKVYVNGREVAFEAYNINGNNYFKLRDIAQVLRGTEKQFEVTWDPTIKMDIGEQSFSGAIVMTSKKPYTTIGGEMQQGNRETKQAKLTTSPILMNNRPVQLTAYNISGNNFFKLRDLGNVFDFNVSWDAGVQAVVVNSAQSYDPAA